jgi:hypothetical protein
MKSADLFHRYAKYAGHWARDIPIAACCFESKRRRRFHDRAPSCGQTNAGASRKTSQAIVQMMTAAGRRAL